MNRLILLFFALLGTAQAQSSTPTSSAEDCLSFINQLALINNGKERGYIIHDYLFNGSSLLHTRNAKKTLLLKTSYTHINWADFDSLKVDSAGYGVDLNIYFNFKTPHIDVLYLTIDKTTQLVKSRHQEKSDHFQIAIPLIEKDKIKDLKIATKRLQQISTENRLQPGAVNKQSKPPFVYRTGKFFVFRNDTIRTENEFLLNSIRPEDKKDTGNIHSKGEGWLDRDSIPCGPWKFYAKDSAGREYLFKSGFYKRTRAELFVIKNMDENGSVTPYKLSLCTLQQDQVARTPFIKSGKWNYYQPNGTLWKTLEYQDENLPIEVYLIMDKDNPNIVRPAVSINETDEWPVGK